MDGGSIGSAHWQLQDDHEARAVLCSELEQIADALPSLPPPARVRRICNQIECITTLHFKRADAMLEQFAAAADPPFASEMLEQVVNMHLMDALHGDDIIMVLWDSTARGGVTCPGEFGYMLRCFFDGCRRVTALESVLFTLLERRARPSF